MKAKALIIISLIFGFVLIYALVVINNYLVDKRNVIEVIGENGKVYDSYNAALYDMDFVAAHNYVDKMKECYPHNSKISANDTQEAYNEVFKKEVSYLMSDNNVVDNEKVIYLLKEVPKVGYYSNNKDILCDYVLDLSILLKNKDLCNMVLDEYESEENKKDAIKRYKKAEKEGKFQE